MPLKNEDVYCVNHENTKMVQNEGFNALIRVERTNQGIVFDNASGIPVLAFYCPDCGYIELYAAQTTKEWDDASQTQEGALFERFRRFENGVIKALSSPNSPLVEHEIRTEAEISAGGKRYEADMIASSGDKVYIIEVKASGSKRSLDSAAAQVRNYVELYRNTLGSKDLQVLPLIIAPSTSIPQDAIFGVPILKFDEKTRRFINPEVVNQSRHEH
jgi:hypothetical protein